jgi:hypothetical protein
MLDENQTYKLLKIFRKFRIKYTDLTLDKFLMEICNKTEQELTPDDLTKIEIIVKTENDPWYRKNITPRQREMVLGVYDKYREKYNITLDEFLTKFIQKADINMLTHYDVKLLMYWYKLGKDYWTKDYYVENINFKKFRYIAEVETDDYIYGSQYIIGSSKSMKIFCFKNILFIDYDSKNLDTIMSNIDNDIDSWAIYETYNGYHFYNISRRFNYSNTNTLKYMFKLGADIKHLHFVRSTGFVLRTSKKIGRDEQFVERYVKTVDHNNIDNNILNIIKYKDTLLEH